MDEPREQVIPRMQIIPSPGNREQQAVAVTSWDDPHESAPAPCPNALKTYKKKNPNPKNIPRDPCGSHSFSGNLSQGLTALPGRNSWLCIHCGFTGMSLCPSQDSGFGQDQVRPRPRPQGALSDLRAGAKSQQNSLNAHCLLQFPGLEKLPNFTHTWDWDRGATSQG